MAQVTSSKRQKFQTYLLVSMVTILVWLYAEAETVKPETMQIDVMFEGSNYQLVDPAAPFGVNATFRCNASQLADLEGLKTTGQAFKIDVTAREDGAHAIPLLERIEKNPRIQQLGIVVERVNPPEKQVRIERLEKVEVAVEFDRGNRELADQAVIDPSSVIVTAPLSLKPWLTSIKLPARLDEERFAGLAEGVEHKLTNVSIDLPYQLQQRDGVSISHDAVSVAFTIIRQTDTLASQLSVLIQGPAPAMADFQIVPEEEGRVTVELTGPRSTIEKIKARELTEIWAELRFRSYEDLAQLAEGAKPVSRFLAFHLPPGVTASPKRISFSVQRGGKPSELEAGP
jgi:hypothetical protein